MKPTSYNVLLGFDADKKVNRITKAMEVYERLIKAGYEKEAALQVIKTTFLVDLRESDIEQ